VNSLPFIREPYRRRAFLAALTTGLSIGLLPAVRADEEAAPNDSASAAYLLDEDSILTLPLDDPALTAPPKVAAAVAPLPRTSKDAAAPPKLPGRIVVQKFQQLQWSPGGHSFRSQGSVQIVYYDPNDPKDKGTTLTAKDVVADAELGQVEARGGVRLERAEGVITGDEIKYNFNSRAGYFTNALAETAYFRMRGKRIETEADGSYVVLDGVFTTCIKGRPDYQIRAKRLAVSPNRYVSARGITFYAGGSKLITLPAYRRNLRRTAQAPLPTPGYSKSEGITLRLQDSLIAQPRQTLDFDVRLNFKRTPSGLFAYQSDLNHPPGSDAPPGGLLPLLTDPLRGYLEQLNPPTYREYAANRYDIEAEPRASFYAVLQSRQFVYNRRRSDLLVSRFPEIGVRFTNILGHSRPAAPGSAPTEGPARPIGSVEAATQRVPNAPFLLDVAASFGAMREEPTNLTTGRFALRADLASQPITLGRRLSLRLGATDWFNVYTQGDTYNLLSSEVELNFVPTRTSLFGIGYRYLSDVGSTPFFSDRRDARHELRLRYQVGGPWAFGFVTKYDLERSRAYDSEFAILRNLDCMQIGIAYRFRSQSFNLIFNLLPPTPDRENRIRSAPTDIGSVASGSPP
jgi:hypothetical protein